MTDRGSTTTFTVLRERIERHLQEIILPFWLEHAVDETHGGFVAEMSCDHVVNEEAPKGLILNARLLWTFAALQRWQADTRVTELAHRAYHVLTSTFWDPIHGGLFWTVTPQGDCLNPQKKIYGQAFAIYALCEYSQTFEQPAALERALAIYDLIETHSHDSNHGGYLEVCEGDWSPATNNRLSDKDMDEKKSMNNHLHVLEAYTHLYACHPKPHVGQQLGALIELFTTRIATEDQRHLNHFFNETWDCRSDSYTYGHDIEASWLLCEAAEILDDPTWIERTDKLALSLAQATLEEAIDSHGGLCYEGRHGQIVNTDREWWPQAEATVGFLNAYQLSGKTPYLQTVQSLWDFIERHLVDHERGEWVWRVDAQGLPDRGEPKLSQWKAPYHNVRACLECMRRLSQLENHGT